MEVKRTTTITVRLHKRDVIAALKRLSTAFDGTTPLDIATLPDDAEGVQFMADAGGTLSIHYTRST